MDNTQIDTGEPFLLTSLEEGFDNYEEGNLIIVKGENNNAVLSLLRVIDIPASIQTLDKKYLPLDSQADWNENNNSSISFIQNRTHWEDIETITTSY
jgi:hypothetical protein